MRPFTLKRVHEREFSSTQFMCCKQVFKPRYKKVKITEHRVPELIPVLVSQPASDVSHKPGSRLPLLSARPAVTLASLRGLLPVSLLGEQRHN